MSNLPFTMRSRRFAVLAGLFLMASACTNDSADLREYVAQVKSRSGGPIEKLPPAPRFPRIPEINQASDPFESFLDDGSGERREQVEPQKPAWPPRNPEELERYALDSLRMVGTVERDHEQWGLVRDPGGVIHRVRPGNFMGRNHGKILEVSELRIQLLEKIPDGRGDWAEREAEIALSE